MQEFPQDGIDLDAADGGQQEREAFNMTEQLLLAPSNAEVNLNFLNNDK